METELYLGFSIYAWITIATVLIMFTTMLVTKLRSDVVFLSAIGALGATAEMIPGITETTVVYPAGYLDLTKEDITEILKESM